MIRSEYLLQAGEAIKYQNESVLSTDASLMGWRPNYLSYLVNSLLKFIYDLYSCTQLF